MFPVAFSGFDLSLSDFISTSWTRRFKWTSSRFQHTPSIDSGLCSVPLFVFFKFLNMAIYHLKLKFCWSSLNNVSAWNHYSIYQHMPYKTSCPTWWNIRLCDYSGCSVKTNAHGYLVIVSQLTSSMLPSQAADTSYSSNYVSLFLLSIDTFQFPNNLLYVPFLYHWDHVLSLTLSGTSRAWVIADRFHLIRVTPFAYLVRSLSDRICRYGYAIEDATELNHTSARLWTRAINSVRKMCNNVQLDMCIGVWVLHVPTNRSSIPEHSDHIRSLRFCCCCCCCLSSLSPPHLHPQPPSTLTPTPGTCLFWVRMKVWTADIISLFQSDSFNHRSWSTI